MPSRSSLLKKRAVLYRVHPNKILQCRLLISDSPYGFVSVGNGWAYLIGIIVGALFIAIVAPMVVDFNEDTQISEEISEDDIEIEIQI